MEYIQVFKEKIKSEISDDEIFNIYTLKKKGLLDGFTSLYINDVFMEGIIKSTKGIQTIEFDNNIMFIKSNNEQFYKKEMINKIINDNNITNIWDLKNYLRNMYSIVVKSEKIIPLVDLELKNFSLKNVNEEVVVLKLGKEMKSIRM